MTNHKFSFVLLACVVAGITLLMLVSDSGDDPANNESTFASEIDLRRSVSRSEDAEREYTLNDVLQIARDMLVYLKSDVRDYRALLVSRERVGGRLRTEATIELAVRNPSTHAGVESGLAAYLKFLAPSSSKDREVIWQDGVNDNRLTSHEGGFKRNLGRMTLVPDGPLAMYGNKYPITQIGLIRLVEKLIEKGERDQQLSQPSVAIIEDQMVGDRTCRLIQVTHPKQLKGLDFHIARIYIDAERKVPLRYAAYLWPASEDDSPPLEEEYTYLDLELNVGLADTDFDPDNPNYDFP